MTRVSFEVAPPRNPGAAPKFWAAVQELAAAQPDFISVTYGAGGSTRGTSREVVSNLLAETNVRPLAHLTCVGVSRATVAATIDEFLDSRVTAFLALRGDPPQDEPKWRAALDGMFSSLDLIELLRERAARSSRHVNGLTLAVAAFPNGNPAVGTTRSQEVQRLLAKQHAGADFAITQLFYEAGTYVDFVAQARAAGVVIPILPGILPVFEPGRLRRLTRISGIVPPRRLLDALDELSDFESRYRYGLDYSAELAGHVLDAGAPGLHVYTFNQAQPALDLLASIDVRKRGGCLA